MFVYPIVPDKNRMNKCGPAAICHPRIQELTQVGSSTSTKTGLFYSPPQGGQPSGVVEKPFTLCGKNEDSSAVKRIICQLECLLSMQ